MVFFMSSGTPCWPEKACPNAEPRLSSWDLSHGARYNRSSALSTEEQDLFKKPLHVVANATRHVLDAMSFLTVEEGVNKGRNLWDHYKGYMALGFQVSPSTRPQLTGTCPP